MRLASLLLLALLAALPARAFETQARALYVHDMTTGTDILKKNADTPLPPASMSKLMTLEMLFDALDEGRVTLETRFPVSTRAKEMGGSTMFLDETDRPTVEDLIEGIIVQSGNDACVVVAEGLAGTEAAFARRMTKRAKELGLKNSRFANASGWPDPGQRMSVHDLGRLAAHIIATFPQYYHYFAVQEYDYDGRAPRNRFNRNPLLALDIGADGLKTGHTSKAGYGLVGSAERDGRRIVMVVAGLGSEAERAEESERIINWAFREFVDRTVFDKGEQVATADVWLGEQGDVGLVTAAPVELLVPAAERDGITAEAEFTSPVRAPVAAGDELGTLRITVPGLSPVTTPLVAGAAVPRGGFGVRLRTAADVLLTRAQGSAQDLY